MYNPLRKSDITDLKMCGIVWHKVRRADVSGNIHNMINVLQCFASNLSLFLAVNLDNNKTV